MFSFSIRLLLIGVLISAAAYAQTDPLFRLTENTRAFFNPASTDLHDQFFSVRFAGRLYNGTDSTAPTSYGTRIECRTQSPFRFSLVHMHNVYQTKNWLENDSLYRTAKKDVFAAGALYRVAIGSNSILSLGVRAGLVNVVLERSTRFNPQPPIYAMEIYPAAQRSCVDLSIGAEYRIINAFYVGLSVQHPDAHLLEFPGAYTTQPWGVRMQRTSYLYAGYQHQFDDIISFDANVNARYSDSIKAVEPDVSLQWGLVRIGMSYSIDNIEKQHPLSLRLGLRNEHFDLMLGIEPRTGWGYGGELTSAYRIGKESEKKPAYNSDPIPF